MRLSQAVCKRYTNMNSAILKRMKKSTLLFHHGDIVDKKIVLFRLIEYNEDMITTASLAEIAQLESVRLKI